MPDIIAGSIVELVIATDSIALVFALMLIIFLEMLAAFETISYSMFARINGSNAAIYVETYEIYIMFAAIKSEFTSMFILF